MKALILYSTRDGQTREIAARIAQTLVPQQLCDVQDLAETRQIDWSQYDRVLIGASIRYGHFDTALMTFVTQHRQSLQQRVSGFFSVNLTARKADKRSPQTNAYTRKFLEQSPWQPDCCAVFAGALRYPRYRWFDRVMIQLIMRMTGGETDTSKEVEYTDWSAVSRFAYEFAQLPGKSL
ncbi:MULTISPECIES: menaquinone-dependent protoporphyrinogen IX dehydrogenase [Pantoea]|jgi:menaquinone-dependent protoporphyrinogen oxidase|uniref:Protoporphyrinogen IX dehydrogenase [quinone] n=1 Tax=Pantoea eucrina TaxID=472693 RepID=A0ABS1Z6K7_9GAMM|nr:MULTISPECIES: menaquinone-dependent protoporphyrinogen IX dehydrogenase [Pantoea]AIX49924.1 protoporphyrinogen oxidase [Pantoea sp. PSNIH1]MBM0748060.1 menaquinone-dependent protoporphyrinogen IX dehydrogenase [Pantoea eucrina]MCL9647958.1 menaquinone-dependent protoporphyrinogen IX dehydrogenase [Pantoea eucrina]MDJ0024842.1 menaquinone-dependent protoporphyrinogen IX dehydrogenase [Pantoea eucrina]ORM79070.1 protoporphyrinogen oxidase [Pantoea eucrina]